MKIKINELLTQLTVLCSLIMLAFTGEIGINTSKYCLYLIVGMCLVKLCFLRIRASQLTALVIILLSCMMNVHRDNPANHLIFFTSVTMAVTLFRFGIDRTSWKLLKLSAVVASVWFVFQFLSGNGFDTMDRLVLSFDNPNMTGIALCAPAMVLVLMAAEAKNAFLRLLYGMLLAAMAYLVYQTNNRGSFFTVVAFVVLAYLAVRKKKPLRVTHGAIYAVLKLMPIVVMFVYVFLYTVLPADLELLGKPFFSGREYAWKVALGQLFKNPFSHYAYEDGTLNLFLEGIRRYGIFSMVGYFWILFTLHKPNLKEVSNRSYLAYLGFHLFLFQQSFESTLITGSYSVYIWTYMLLGVSSMKEPEDEEHKLLNIHYG